MIGRGRRWGLVLIAGVSWSGVIMGQDVDPDEVQRLVDQYIQQEEASKKATEKPAPALDYDHEAWKSAEKCGTKACFEAYLEDYPKGRYAKMARARLQPLTAPPVVVERPIERPAPMQRSENEPEMVQIPSECFQMGSPASEEGRGGNERQHRVCVGAFEIGKYEVTQREWQAMMGGNPSYFKKGDRYPVETVSWNDVHDYIRTLNQRTGQQYRLPTEAEWEYACRGGAAGERYCGGNSVDQVAWYNGNSGEQTQPVGRKAPNGVGLYDMSGNVWEWTCSLYDGDYGGAKKECNYNEMIGVWVIRGGSWDDEPAGVRSANRDWNRPANRNNHLGFRLARSL